MVAPSQQMKGGVAGFSGYSQLTSSDRSLKYWSRVKRYYFMYLRAIFCTFQISVDFYYVPVGGRGGAGEGEGARERGIECILYGYT